MKKSRNQNTSAKKKSGTLSEEERKLWEHVAKSVDPIKQRGRAVIAADEKTPSDKPTKTTAPRDAKQLFEEKQSTKPAKEQTPLNLNKRDETSRQSSTPPLANFEHRKARRIRSGAIAIDARIDLHGMRQDEAHRVLRQFLISSRAQGCRWVLVITGKGSRQKQTYGYDDRPFDAMPGPEPGVLRQRVPQWLGEPDLRTIVVSYTRAGPQHGGSGALYVQLRSRQKS